MPVTEYFEHESALREAMATGSTAAAVLRERELKSAIPQFNKKAAAKIEVAREIAAQKQAEADALESGVIQERELWESLGTGHETKRRYIEKCDYVIAGLRSSIATLPERIWSNNVAINETPNVEVVASRFGWIDGAERAIKELTAKRAEHVTAAQEIYKRLETIAVANGIKQQLPSPIV